MKKAIFLLVALLATGNLFAKKLPATVHNFMQIAAYRTINGTVKDVTGESVPGAVVKLIIGGDSVSKSTDTNGIFVFANIKSTSSFTLIVSSIGYETFTKQYRNLPSESKISLPQITLQSKALMLQSVNLNGSPGVVLKTDVVEYQASSYKVQGNAGVEELLKKMEGMEVSANGSITHNGQTVTKVRLNGKDYAGGDVRSAMKNLPADIIEKAQVIDDYGDQASKAGIKSGDPSKILNLVFNDGYYTGAIDNKYQVSRDNPLSTFSVDVDNASYGNLRNYINNGQLPPKDAVRIEEMINYFKYQLPEPKGNDPVAITTELSAAPWESTHRLLRIGLKARSIPANRAATNLVLLINLTGAGNKLPLVKQSLKMLVEQLRPQDKVSIVVCNGSPRLALLPTRGDHKDSINNIIDKLGIGGSVAGGAAIKLAYKTARDNFKKEGNNRIILVTDGDFNIGIGSEDSAEALIAKERESGIDLSVLGYGLANNNDDDLKALADNTNGNYLYIDNVTEANKALIAGFGGTMFTVAKDVKLQVEFNPNKVQAYRLIGYENRMLPKEDFNNDKADAGDMGSGHTVTALYEIIPAGIKDDYAGNVDELKYRKVEKKIAVSDELLTVKFRYKEPQGMVSKLSETVLKDTPKDFDKQPADYRFAAAVAEVGMLLRDSEFKGKSDYEQAIKIASQAKGSDEGGYRSEFIRLVESVKLLQKAELAKGF